MAKGLIVLTGCDSGIGKGLVELLVSRGHTVAASYLNENPFENTEGVFTKRMDLRNEDEISGFIGFIDSLCDEGYEVSHFVSNSGIAAGGPIENVPLSVYRESFDINFFGAIPIIQALIPRLARTKGCITVMGSIAGRVASPFLSPYASTKFATRGFCDSLRREMRPFGIRTVLIEPAAIATPIWRKAMAQDTSHIDGRYMKSVGLFLKRFVESGSGGLDMDTAVRRICGIMFRKRPRARYLIAKSLPAAFLTVSMPGWIIDVALGAMLRMDCGYDGRRKRDTRPGS